jgi:hypothetical protein
MSCKVCAACKPPGQRFLHGDGWAFKVVANNLEARHSEVEAYAEAVARLKRLQIEEDAITDIAEWSDEGRRLWPVGRNLCNFLHKLY